MTDHGDGTARSRAAGVPIGRAVHRRRRDQHRRGPLRRARPAAHAVSARRPSARRHRGRAPPRRLRLRGASGIAEGRAALGRLGRAVRRPRMAQRRQRMARRVLGLARPRAADLLRSGRPRRWPRSLDRPDRRCCSNGTCGRHDGASAASPAPTRTRGSGSGRRPSRTKTACSLRVPSYEASFRAFVNHVVLDGPLTGDAAVDAAHRRSRRIREGRVFTSIDGLAQLCGVRGEGHDRRRAFARPGEYLDPDGPVAIEARIAAPDGTTLVVAQGRGADLRPRGRRASASTSASSRAPTASRRGCPRSIARIDGAVGADQSDLRRPARARMRRAAAAAAVPPATSRSASATAAVAGRSRGRDRPSLLTPGTLADGTPALAVAIRAGRRTAREQYAAVHFPVDQRLAGHDRLQFRVQSDRPHRLWVQVRAPGEGGGRAVGAVVLCGRHAARPRAPLPRSPSAERRARRPRRRSIGWTRCCSSSTRSTRSRERLVSCGSRIYGWRSRRSSFLVPCSWCSAPCGVLRAACSVPGAACCSAKCLAPHAFCRVRGAARSTRHRTLDGAPGTQHRTRNEELGSRHSARFVTLRESQMIVAMPAAKQRPGDAEHGERRAHRRRAVAAAIEHADQREKAVDGDHQRDDEEERYR